MQQAEIGIIGGSGLYSMPGFSDTREVRLQTPFGDPSDPYVMGTLAGRKVGIVALARKLSIALWRFVEQGVVPEGAALKS